VQAVLRRRVGQVAAFARQLPERVRSLGWREWLHLASVLFVWLVLILWWQSWYDGNYAALWDGKLQPDDARTAIFPFHRYAEGAPLADDPISNEMLEYQPYAYRLLFFLTVPFVGVLQATKLVAWLLIGIVVAAGVVLASSKRAGLGAGILFAFIFLHDANVQDRIIGGLPRSFGFPLTALWLAGAFASRPWVRRTAALLSALTYPTALAMVLGAEGVYAVRGFARPGLATLLRRLKHYALLLAACAALLAPAVLVGMSDGGPIHTLEQAQNEPAFGRSGRLRVLPFPDPGEAFGKAFYDTFKPSRGSSPTEGWKEFVERHESEIAMAIAAALLLLPLMRVTPVPLPAIAFLAASLTLYAIARGYAFKLYSPERYYSIGMRVVALSLFAGTFGLVAPRLSLRYRATLRNVVAGVVVWLVWFGLGNGVGNPPMSYDIDYRRDARLWDWLKNTPIQSRFACHIGDCDSFPLFGQRANMGGFETLQPWLTKSWARQVERTEETFRAIYATKREEALAYAKKHRVTHFVINTNRYGDDFVSKAKSFEPFSTFTRDLLSDRTPADLVFAEVPPEAVVFRYGRLQIVSVANLEKAWAD
jgi:hypothetical protein